MDNKDKYISALGLMAKRLRLRGGSPQQDRMIKDMPTHPHLGSLSKW